MADADAGAVDAAVLALLRADLDLLAVCPDGVQYAVADPACVRFVLVERVEHAIDGRMFGGPAGETFVYRVNAVLPESLSRNAREAARLIRARLDGATVLGAAGYGLQTPIAEVGDVRRVEVDAANPERRVQHWGGIYSVIVQTT